MTALKSARLNKHIIVIKFAAFGEYEHCDTMVASVRVTNRMKRRAMLGRQADPRVWRNERKCVNDMTPVTLVNLRR